ncbi:helix-turn-helix domain-containing protein [Roseovarius aestuariivivens]|uniref:helix-turn-helix domain-containing protein n=1 Tax=Roseovarius aestuariivivens TaxID=1888910 RepID=UPI001AEC2237|nr:helix-turn-helix transcriptional regulator [Roseovarius aestuariivivens]
MAEVTKPEKSEILFDLGVSEKDLHASDFMARTNRKLIAAFLSEAHASGLTKAELARRIGVDRSVITKILRGKSNLTERSIGELAWALGYDAELQLKKCEYGDNFRVTKEQKGQIFLTASSANAAHQGKGTKPAAAVNTYVIAND